MPTLPQWHPLPLYMEVASVCAAAASSFDSGGPGGATSVYRSCCSEMGWNGVVVVGGTGVAKRERRGWTHSLLLITDQNLDWSPLIPDQLNLPLLSPLAHQSALQQPQVLAWWGLGGRTWMAGWTLFLSLSHFFSLTVRIKTDSTLHPAPYTSDPPTCGHRGLHLDSWRVWTVELQSIMFKLKKKKRRCCHLGQLFALCGVSSQPITWHLYVTILWFILLWPINTQHGGIWELDCGKCGSSGCKQWNFGTAGSTLVWRTWGKTGNAEWDMWHICASEKLLLRYWFCLYRECFALEKETHLRQLKIGVGQQNIDFFFFFSAYSNCPRLSIQRGR